MKTCKHCGLTEAEHHVFEASTPEGCICDPGEWDAEIPEVCDRYDGNGITFCLRCAHDLECHQ